MSGMAGATVVTQRQHDGLPSIADIPGAVIPLILSLVQSATDRNRASEVCRSFRFYERQTRRSLVLRALQRHLGQVPLCFSNVTDLDLSALTLIADEVPTFKLEKFHQIRVRRAFPNVRSLKVRAMSNESVRGIGSIWPRIESISFAHQKDGSDIPRLETVFETFKYLEALDARNVSCESLAGSLSRRRSLRLKSFNLETLVIVADVDIDLLAEKCRDLESLCITISPGLVTGECFLKLAEKCRKLSKLRLFLYSASSPQVTAEGARECLNFLARMASELPDLETSFSLQDIPASVTGSRMECLLGMTASIRSLVLYSSDAQISSISSCSNLTEITFGGCEGLGDLELVPVITKCPKLHTVRILDCRRITWRGLKFMAENAKLKSLSLCFLKMSVKAQVDAIKPLSGSLTALRLMVNGPVDSLSGLGGWPKLSRLEVTVTSHQSQDKPMEPCLEPCPDLKHLGLVCQTWCPSTRGLLSISPSLASLSLTFSQRVTKQLLLSSLQGISHLPQLSSLSLFVSNEEWLCGEAGAVLATCPKLKSLNIVWTATQLPTDYSQSSTRPFLLMLLTMKCLQNVQLPSSLIDEKDWEIFYQGLHAHNLQSILRSLSSLRARDPNQPWEKKRAAVHRGGQPVR